MPFPLLILLLRLNFFPLNLGAHSRTTWVQVLVLRRKQYACVDISFLASASVQCYSSSIILPISTVCIVTWVIFACRESLRAFSHAAGFVIIIHNIILHDSIWSRETGSAVPSRVSLLISILTLNLVLTYGIPPEFRGGVHLFV